MTNIKIGDRVSIIVYPGGLGDEHAGVVTAIDLKPPAMVTIEDDFRKTHSGLLVLAKRNEWSRHNRSSW